MEGALKDPVQPARVAEDDEVGQCGGKAREEEGRAHERCEPSARPQAPTENEQDAEKQDHRRTYRSDAVSAQEGFPQVGNFEKLEDAAAEIPRFKRSRDKGRDPPRLSRFRMGRKTWSSSMRAV